MSYLTFRALGHESKQQIPKEVIRAGTMYSDTFLNTFTTVRNVLVFLYNFVPNNLIECQKLFFVQ